MCTETAKPTSIESAEQPEQASPARPFRWLRSTMLRYGCTVPTVSFLSSLFTNSPLTFTRRRIENALGKKLDEYQVVKDEVMVLSESVGEAQRRAIRELKDMQENGMGRHRSRKGPVGKKGKRGRDEMDAEEG